MRQIRSVAAPTEPSRVSPLRNWKDLKIKSFLETAFPIYCHQTDWWKLTLNWYAIAHENSTIEVAGVIYSILLDRISSERLRGIKQPKQFEPNLDDILGKEGKPEWCRVSDHVTTAIRHFCPGWPTDRSGALLKQIKLWNETPSYPKKIALAFSGLPIRPLQRELTDPRHVLLHQGKLVLKGISPVVYYLHLNRFITAALLAMLGYRGEFYVAGLGMDSIPFIWTSSEAEYIRTRAYYIWQERGANLTADSLEDWLSAEREGVPLNIV